jgi:hypothetical protein
MSDSVHIRQNSKTSEKVLTSKWFPGYVHRRHSWLTFGLLSSSFSSLEMTTSFRPSLRQGVLSHRLDDQLVVYDVTADRIHLLDGTTATVYESLQQGAGRNAIESKLDAQQTVGAGAELLALALDELAKARLIDGDSRESTPVMESRRQMLQKLAGVGAALLIPAIVTLAPNNLYSQAATGFVNGTACTSNSQCASNCCATNSAGPCKNKTCSPVTCANCQ